MSAKSMADGNWAPSRMDDVWRSAFSLLMPGGSGAQLFILIFHRVVRPVDPLFPDEVDAVRFDALCGWLNRVYRVMPLTEALTLRARRRLPSRALCITFDDGYADNHDVACPILRAHGLCATFFVTTGTLDGGRMWNDTIIEAVRSTRERTLDVADLRLGALSTLDLGDLEARRRALRKLLAAAKYLGQAERQHVATQIAERSRARLPDDLMMTSHQVRGLAACGMEIGAHTVTHPILARLEEDRARAEIVASKRALEQLLGREVPLFAYPNGKPGQDYLPRDVQLVREAGFRFAVSTAPSAVGADERLDFELPRFTPWDRSRSRFALRMARSLFTQARGVRSDRQVGTR